MEICLIAAVAQNGVIGINNNLPWRLSQDLKHFKALTLNHPVIMGRKTWQSLSKPLVDRANIVLTRQKSLCDTTGKKGKTNSKKEIINNNGKVGDMANSIDEAIQISKNYGGFFKDNINVSQAFVIGGAEIYRHFLPFVSRLFITEVHRDFVGDTYFPNWKNINKDFMEINRESNTNSDGLKYSFVEYKTN